MKLSNTIPHNKSTAFSEDIDLLALMVLKGTPLDWKAVSIAQPHFDQRAIPKRHKKFFSNNSAAVIVDDDDTSGPVPDRPETQRSTSAPLTRQQSRINGFPVP